MIYRYYLLLLLVLFSCTAFAQEYTVDTPQEPILGYYRLGMNIDEYWEQTKKMKEATERTDSVSLRSEYLISINDLDFNVESNTVDYIGYLNYDNYTKETLPLYFTGRNYFLGNKLVSVTVETTRPEMEGAFSYTPAGLQGETNLPKNQRLFVVFNVKLHNQLVSSIEGLKDNLSQKYGKPTKEYPIAKLQPLDKDNTFRQFSAYWFRLYKSGSVLPRAEWQFGNMKIVMGITNSATIFISFLDETELSYQNLNRVFAPTEQPKPTAE